MTPRLIAAVHAVAALLFCAWGTLALARQPQRRAPRLEVPRTPEELSETTLV